MTARTTIVTRRARLADFAGGLRLSRQLRTHDRERREALLAGQWRRLERLQDFARQRSPFYRERPASATLDKTTLMERYDDVLTDRRLSRARLEAHLDALDGDALLDGEYRVMATGGTTGRRAIVPLSRAEWRAAMTGFFRWTELTGRVVKPRRRLATVLAPNARHMSWRYAQTADVGLMRIARLDAGRPLPELVAELQGFQPHELGGYPSALALLAHEQLAGRLSIAPQYVGTSSEVCTPEMAQAIADAWGVRPFDMYAITEAGIIASECEARAGLHVFEDHTMVEVLDDDGRPVRDGEVGRLVVTPLYGRTLPLLRYELGDLVRATTEPCACGRPYRRLIEIQGRQDDVLTLPGARGGTVRLHPIAVRSPLAGVPELAQYQLVHAAGSVRVRVVLRHGADAAAATQRVRARLEAALTGAGAAPGPVQVDVVEALERSPHGKHRLVVQA